MAQVMIPTPLRTFTRGQKTVTVVGTTVDEAMASLTRTYPDLKHHLFSDEGKLRNFVNVYLGEEDVRYLQQGATEIRDTDTLSIVPSVAGGSIGAPAHVLKADKVLDCRAPCPSSALPTPSNRSSLYIGKAANRTIQIDQSHRTRLLPVQQEVEKCYMLDAQLLPRFCSIATPSNDA